MSMLSSIQPKKAKVNLADYAFRRDIETRLFMAHLSLTEVQVLKEIVHHSLKISIEQLAEEMDIEVEELLPILDRLSLTRLFKRQNMTLMVDKEIRKYFEVKMERFDSDFQPDLDFLQGILNKVPIHVLPLWYAIPRTSDNIFESIVERYFLTPKIYRQYLSELQFEDPVIGDIIKEVYAPPYFKVTAEELMHRFNLTHESLEEYLLLLEYHFVCCLSYQQVDGYWQEIVTPFSEWREYLQFEFQTRPQPIQEAVEKDQQVESQFIKDLITLLKASQSKGISLKDVKNLSLYHAQCDVLVNKLIQLEFVKQNSKGQIIATEKGKNWMNKPLFEQVAILANDPLNTLIGFETDPSLWVARNLRLVEKSLRRLAPYEWVTFSDFLRGCIAPIGDREPVTLKNRGKRWRYVLPTYNDQEKEFIHAVIVERLTELGIVETGSWQNHLCFCLTPFGHHFIQ